MHQSVIRRIMRSLLLLLLAQVIQLPASATALLTRRPSADDGYAIFEHPGKMVRLRGGNRLSMYCIGEGRPTVILETGFGGGAYADYHKLEPLVGRFTRVCSYDRAGYGFSELGHDLPRDLRHDVLDLHDLLKASGEPAPYILVGHSDGGHIIGAYSDLYPKQLAGLVFLDAAVLLDKKQLANAPAAIPAAEQAFFNQQLTQIRGCLARTEKASGLLTPRAGDYCLSPEDLKGLPPAMRQAVIEQLSRPDSWRAWLSEAEQHYDNPSDRWEESLLPHRWRHLPIRVFIASIPPLSDAEASVVFGIPAADRKALAEARAGRREWENLQARICEFSEDCRTFRIPTMKHEVQNAVPQQVAAQIEGLVEQWRRARDPQA